MKGEFHGLVFSFSFELSSVGNLKAKAFLMEPRHPIRTQNGGHKHQRNRKGKLVNLSVPVPCAIHHPSVLSRSVQVLYSIFRYQTTHSNTYTSVRYCQLLQKRERVRVERMVHACMHSLTGYIWHAFYFHPHIFNDLYLLNQMSIIETFCIFKFVVTRSTEQDQFWIFLNIFYFICFTIS